jgi:hypothetical protein
VTVRIVLGRIATGRSGDKGDSSNVGLIALGPAAYAWMLESLTPEWVKDRCRGFARGSVERFEVPNLLALNFILHDSLGGGGSSSLLTDAQGKTHAQALLRCEVDVPDAVLDGLAEPGPLEGIAQARARG